MPTIAQQLTQLESDRSDLVDNLETQGITGLSGDETFTELVPEVLNISGGDDLSDYLNLEITSATTSTDTFYTRLLTNKQPVKPTIASNVTSCERIFYQYPGDLDLTDFDFSNFTYCYMPFSSFLGETLIFSENAELPLVNNINSWFSSATNLKSFVFSMKFTICNGMQGIFENCTSLISLDLSKCDISNNSGDINMRRMFRNCPVLENLSFGDFSKFDPSKIGRRDNMFEGCTSLSNESLNNILGMCARINTSDGYSISLASIGLTSDQATICTGLSNWSACESAGWTTGY